MPPCPAVIGSDSTGAPHTVAVSNSNCCCGAVKVQSPVVGQHWWWLHKKQHSTCQHCNRAHGCMCNISKHSRHPQTTTVTSAYDAILALSVNGTSDTVRLGLRQMLQPCAAPCPRMLQQFTRQHKKLQLPHGNDKHSPIPLMLACLAFFSKCPFHPHTPAHAWQLSAAIVPPKHAVESAHQRVPLQGCHHPRSTKWHGVLHTHLLA